MPRKDTWQPGLTTDDRQLARKIADTFEIETTENAAVRFALRKVAKELGVEA